ncbi:MAG: hypothetical protein QOJ04_6863 [Caballeronia sp.]|nr:hypothetical protein [Caballeronia sp.]
MVFEYSLSAKWLVLLKQIAPAVTRAASAAGMGCTLDPAAMNP